DNPAERMPPAKLKKQLTEREVQLLRDWIDQGAKYQKHWAFEPLATPPIPPHPTLSPDVGGEGRVRGAKAFANPIDAFVAAKLHEHGLELSPEAAPETLLRRVSFDLTGLPPTVEELEAYLADLDKPGADRNACYERVVDRLLRSRHFGEHMAVGWLDAARYA